jgi:hypothetical protein
MNKVNWVREFNELFKKINQEGDAYFSGPRFLDVIREFDDTYPNYSQFIEIRNSQSKSTSRKDYFYDVLNEFDEEIKKNIIKRIYEIVDDSFVSQIIKENDKDTIPNIFKQEAQEALKEQIREIFPDNNLVAQKDIIQEKQISHIPPKVFISYSWDNEAHKDWVLKLSEDLRINSVDTILDRYELIAGKNLSHFMEDSIETADKVLIIFTEQYKNKASGRTGGAGIEYSILNSEICEDITGNKKYIPILRSGSKKESIPLFMRQYIAVYMLEDSQYEEQLKEILHAIFEKPMIKKSKIGSIPDFLK